jgi:hypothetical protein
MIENIGQIKQRAAKVVLAVLLLSSLQVAQNQNAFADPYVTGLDTLKIKDGPGTGFEINLDTTTATMTAEVSYETNTVTIWPAFTAPTDSVTIKTIEVSTVDSITATLSVGSNTFSIIAFQAGVEVTSTLTITRAQPDLRIGFDPTGYLSTYDSVTARRGGSNSASFTVRSFTLIDTVTALSLSQVETITVSGVGFGSGNSWMFDELVIGEDNTFDVVTKATVIGDDSPIYETTTVTIQVPSLSGLASTGTLSPAFNSFTKSYTVSVANTVSSITFTPTTEDWIGSFIDSITVAGESVTSTVASSPISLSVGVNTVLIVVNATNPANLPYHDSYTTYDTFTVTVNRAAPVDAGGGGGGGGSSGPSAPVLKTQGAITITSSVTTIEYGNSFKISVSGGNSSSAIKYSSTGTAFCSITSDGLVTAVGKGSCVITATKEADGVYAATSTSITITVTDVTVAGVVTTTTTATTQTMSISKVVAGITTAKVKIGIDYAGDRVSVLLGTKVNGKTTYKTLGSTTVGSTGYVTYKSKVKMPKGSVLRLQSGSEVIFTRAIS